MRSITNNATITTIIVFAFAICSNNLTTCTAMDFNTKEKQRPVPSLRGSLLSNVQQYKARHLQEETILPTPTLQPTRSGTAELSASASSASFVGSSNESLQDDEFSGEQQEDDDDDLVGSGSDDVSITNELSGEKQEDDDDDLVGGGNDDVSVTNELSGEQKEDDDDDDDLVGGGNDDVSVTNELSGEKQEDDDDDFQDDDDDDSVTNEFLGEQQQEEEDDDVDIPAASSAPTNANNVLTNIPTLPPTSQAVVNNNNDQMTIINNNDSCSVGRTDDSENTQPQPSVPLPSFNTWKNNKQPSGSTALRGTGCSNSSSCESSRPTTNRGGRTYSSF
jgi:hypothetical protein